MPNQSGKEVKEAATVPASRFQRVISQSGIYAVGNMLIKASGILLAPIYLNPKYLLEVEFGTFALLEVTGQIAVLAIGLGLHAALMKYMSDKTWKGDRDAIPFTVLLTVIGSSLLFCGLLYVFAPFLARTLIGDPGRTGILRLFLIYIGLKSTLVIPYTLMRFQERASLYVLASVAEIGVLISSVYWFVVHQGLGLRGIVLAFIVSTVVSTLILMPAALRGIAWHFDRNVSRTLLKYGLPLAIGGLAVPVLHAGDRYLIEWFIDTETVAVYAWGSRISGILNMLFVQSFNLAFMVVGLKSLGADSQDYSLHQRTLRHYSAGAAWCALALAVFAGDITRLLGADANYLEAAVLVFPLSLGYFFYGIYLILVNALFAGSRTKTIGSLVVSAAALNLVLNTILIPRYGIAGAAASTLIAYCGLAAMAYIYSQRIAPVSYNWSVVARCLIAATIPFVVWTLIPSDSFGIRVLLVVGYAPILIMMGVYSSEEFSKLVNLARKYGR